MDTKVFKAKNNEAGTFTAVLSDTEVSSASVSPVPVNAPGIIVAEPGTSKEEHIHYKTKDDIAGTISGLTRDYTNLNGNIGQEHISNTPWETLQGSEYVNNLVDAIKEGYSEEQNTIVRTDADTFTVSGNQASVYTKGRIVRFNVDSTIVGNVLADSVYAGGVTTVNIEGTTIPDPLTSVEIGIAPKGAISDVVHEDMTQTLTHKNLADPTNVFPADSYVVEIPVFGPGSDTATGDGKAMFRVPAKLNGMNLTGVSMCVYTAGVTGDLDVQVRNITQTADMLSTKMRIETGEVDTSTSAQPGTIDTANDDVATGDRIAIDVDAVQTGTAAKGLVVELTFALP